MNDSNEGEEEGSGINSRRVHWASSCASADGALLSDQERRWLPGKAQTLALAECESHQGRVGFGVARTRCGEYCRNMERIQDRRRHV